MDYLDLSLIHSQTIWREYEPQVLNPISMEMTFFGIGIKSMFLEVSENFVDMLMMLGWVIKVD